jgi:hypothetical protein
MLSKVVCASVWFISDWVGTLIYSTVRSRQAKPSVRFLSRTIQILINKIVVLIFKNLLQFTFSKMFWNSILCISLMSQLIAVWNYKIFLTLTDTVYDIAHVINFRCKCSRITIPFYVPLLKRYKDINSFHTYSKGISKIFSTWKNLGFNKNTAKM